MLDSIWQEVVGGLVAAWLLLLSWIGKRQVDRIDRLEEGKVSIDKLSELEAKIDRHYDDSRRRAELLYQKLDQIAASSRASVDEQHRINLEIMRRLGVGLPPQQ